MRPSGIHQWALVGEPPEHREWHVGDPILKPQIDPTAWIDAFCTVDGGFREPTRIGARSWLQKRVHIGHDVQIGEDCEICVGAVICGEVVIGDGAKIAGNVWVKPCLRIGEGAVIGGGSVVTKNVEPHTVVCGNPARYHALAWSHPGYLTVPERALHPDPHPFENPDDLWEQMAPYHFKHGAVQGK